MKRILILSLVLCASAHAKSKPKPAKPTQTELNGLAINPTPIPEKPQAKPPITQAEASAVLQVAGGFLQILTDPNDPTHIATGIGAMASGMANLFYQLMKSKGFDAQMNNDELHDLATEMADMVNRGVAIEMVRRNSMQK